MERLSKRASIKSISFHSLNTDIGYYLLNYKKYIPTEIINKLTKEEKYLLAVRNIDKDQIVTRGESIGQLHLDENPRIIYSL